MRLGRCSMLLMIALIIRLCFSLEAAQAAPQSASQPLPSIDPSIFLAPDFIAADQLIRRQLKREEIPGIAIAYVVDGVLTHERGFGRADDSGRVMTADTPSAIGSVSKSFTAVVVMQLVEEGQLQLDQRASLYLPELETAPDVRARAITVRHLLNHRSGYSTYDGNFGQADVEEAATDITSGISGRNDALEEKLERLVGVSLNAAPGARFEYSNANYQLLGLIVERLDRMSFALAVKHRIFEKLGMTSSFVRTPGDRNLNPAVGHRFWAQSAHSFGAPIPPGVVAQGGIYASAHDLAVYLLDLMSPQPKLLSAAGRDELFRADTAAGQAGYGLGWYVEHRDGHRFIYHGGSNPGFESIAGFVPEHQFGFVALANAGTGFVGGNVAGTLDRLQALTFGPDKPLQDLPLANLAIAGVLCLLLSWLVGAVLRALRSKPSGWQWLYVFLSIFIAATFFYALPKLFGIPLPGLIAFAPDIGWLLASIGGLAALNAGLRLFGLGRHLLGHVSR